jgi:hypothetical protein
MLSLILLAQLSTPVPAGPTVSAPINAPAPAALPLAERPRGTAISDPSGSLLGIVDASDAKRVIMVVGTQKVQVPANALQKSASQVKASVTRQQVEALMTASAAFQERSHAAPKAVPSPRGFIPLKASQPAAAGSSIPAGTP